MDAGCYSVNFMRYIMGSEPTSVSEATCVTQPSTPNTDDTAVATLAFDDPSKSATIRASLVGPFLDFFPTATVVCANGTLEFYNMVLPTLYPKILVRPTNGPSRVEQEYGDGSTTYAYQLRAFVDAVRNNKPFPTTAEDGVKNMHVIDMIYDKLGLARRQGKPVPQ